MEIASLVSVKLWQLTHIRISFCALKKNKSTRSSTQALYFEYFKLHPACLLQDPVNSSKTITVKEGHRL